MRGSKRLWLRRARAPGRVLLPLAVLALLPLQTERTNAAAAPQPEQQRSSPAETDEDQIRDLIQANHILAAEGVLDGFGHVSVRSVANPNHFYMARSRAPGLVSRDDIMEFDEDSRPVDQRGRGMYGERFIHGEIFRARPDVQAVVHSHSPDVLPFTVTRTPFKALIHMAAFLGDVPAPIFEIRDVLGPDNRILVSESRTGAALASSLGSRAVVLMRGHGMAVVGTSVKIATLRAVYTQLNARIESEALRLGDPIFLNTQEAERTDPVDRPWEMWVAEAQRQWPLAPSGLSSSRRLPQ